MHLLYDASPFAGRSLVIHAIHLAVAATVLVGTVAPLGRRHMEILTLALLVGLALNVYAYLRFLPSVLPTLALASLLLGSTAAVFSVRLVHTFRANLDRRNAELRALSARLMTIQEEERRRLSRELHDGVGQSLTAVSSYLWLIERRLPAEFPELRANTADARQLVTRTLGEMRELSQLLCPPVLQLYGLVPSLDEHLKAVAGRHQLRTRFLARGLPERLPADMETAIYRITQEALTNVVRHARATSVRVALTASADVVRLEVEDDGIGLHAGTGRAVGTGLIGIEERVRALGGTLTIRSRGGTRLDVRLPRPPDTAAVDLARDSAVLHTCAPRAVGQDDAA
jgi:signal transduction histidine kinase